ncbi:MAG: AraC family transcriptional regulator [Bacteroidales bacterium]|nr:AraC family transcriptional regulator [Bacteroidales bacterium]
MNTDKNRNNELPVLFDSSSIIRRTAWENNEILVAEIGNYADENMPKYFRTSHYAILFVTQGSLSGKVNMVDFEMKAPAAVYIFNDHVLHYNNSSPDLKVRLISFSPVIAEELSLSLHYDNLQYAYARPAAQLDETSMQTIMHYLDLMEILMQKESQERRTTIIKLIQSLSSFFYEFHANSLSSQKPFSRSEELAGQFLSLVDMHCHEHHNIKWYADALHLTPVYVSNVVKQVTGRTAGDNITDCLVRKAKSLLLTSTLSIQQISDRLGFQNQSHFGTFFRRAVGTSPQKFRRND